MILFLVSCAFVFLIYTQGLSSTVFGADSGDIILASWFGGIAHPPGYPLNTMIGWVFTHFPFQATVAYKANLMSAFLQASTIAVIFLIINRLVKNKIIAAVASLTLAFTPIFWLYAHVAEVFQLLNLLIVVSLYFLISWYQSRDIKGGKNINSPNRDLYISILFLGLSFFHHQTTILLLPAWLYLIFKVGSKFFSFRKNILKSVGLFLLGALPYIFVFTAIFRDIPIKWDNPTTIGNFVRLITRADYGTFVANSELVGFSLHARFINIFWYFKVLKTDFTWIGIILFLAGFYYLFRKKRELFWFLVIVIFFPGPFFSMYASFPPFRNFILGTLEKFFMLSYLFWAVVLAFGLYSFYSLIKYLVRNKQIKETANAVVLGSFLFIPISFLVLNYAKSDLSHYVLGQTLAEDLLSHAEPPGIIFLEGDTIVFNTQYSYYVDKANPDSIIILAGSLKHSYYRELLKKQYSELIFPENFLVKEGLPSGDVANRIIELNAEKFPIYSNVTPDVIPEGFSWINEGILGRYYRSGSVPSDREIAEKLRQNINTVKFKKELIEGQYLHFIPAHIRDIYTEYFVLAGYFLLNRNLDNEADKFFDLALDVENDYSGALIAKGDLAMRKNFCDEAEKYYTRAIEVSTISIKLNIYAKLGNLYKECFKDSEKAEIFFKRTQQNSTKLY